MNFKSEWALPPRPAWIPSPWVFAIGAIVYLLAILDTMIGFVLFGVIFLVFGLRALRPNVEARRDSLWLIAFAAFKPAIALFFFDIVFAEPHRMERAHAFMDRAPIVAVLLWADASTPEVLIMDSSQQARKRLGGGFPEEATDPFTHKPFLHTANGTYYSIGPDRRDDALEIIYDPTNGTTSSGDIPPPTPRPTSMRELQ